MTLAVPGSLIAVRKESARTLRRARVFFDGSGQPKPEAIRDCVELIVQSRGALAAIGAASLAQHLAALEARINELGHGAEPWENVRRMFGTAIGAIERKVRTGKNGDVTAEQAALPGGPEAEARLREARQLFERGLLQLLRDRPDRSSLSQMLSAVQFALVASRSEVDREFWNMCVAVMEAMIHGGVVADAYCKRFCARLNLLLSRATSGEGMNVPLPFAEALKILDSSRPVTARIQAIQLGSSTPPLGTDTVGNALPDPQLAAQVCQTLKEYLERFAAGESVAIEEFRRLLANRFEKDLAAVMPQWLIAQVLRAVQRFELPDHARCIESAAIAVAFMEAEFSGEEPSVVRADKFADWLADADQAARAPLSRAKISFTHPMRAELICVPGATKTTTAALRARMRVAEQLLEEFFSGSMDQDLAGSISECLTQIAGAMHMLRLPRAAAALRNCETQLQRVSRLAPARDDAQRDRLIEAFCALSAFVDGIEEDAHDITDLTAEELTLASTATQVPVQMLPDGTEVELPRVPSAETIERRLAMVPVIAQPALTVTPDDDDDRLSIFVEEAESVLQQLVQHLRPGAQALDQGDIAREVRRAFHTMKGSSRMVGLLEFSDAAWRLEQVFDRWVDGRTGSAIELHRLATYASDVLGRSVAALAGEGEPSQELGEIERLAQRLLDGESLADSSIEEDPTMAGAERDTSTAPPAKLSEIYAREANIHLTLLQRACQDLESNRETLVRTDMVRAAHTLASASATMRFESVNAVGAALEIYLAGLMRLGSTPTAQQISLIRSATRSLEESIAMSLQGATVAMEPELISALTQIEVDGDEHATGMLTPTELTDGTMGSAPLAHAAAEAEASEVADDIDQQLMPSFLVESEELLPLIGNTLRQLRSDGGDTASVANLLRRLHTLKGSARMTGAMAIGALIHGMESTIRGSNGEAEFSAARVDELESTLDRVSTLIQALRAPGDVAGEKRPTKVALTTAARSHFPQFLRVDVGVVDRLVNDSGEMVVARAGIERELHALDSALREQMERLARLRAQFHELEIQAESQLHERPSATHGSAHTTEAFDPLEFDRYTRLQELTRMMAETVSDLGAIRQNMARSVDASIAALVTQSRVTKQVQRDLVSLRMVPFSTITDRLYRVVRQAAKDARKRANLDIHGGEVRVDRGVLDRVTAPLEHLLRNSIAHGIEHAARREELGKSEVGQVSLHISQQAGEIQIIHRDDGAGLDLPRIREQAIARRLISATEQSSAASLAEYIFLPGFSTVSTTTDLAGRGVGLDVVQTEIRLLSGFIGVASTPNVETIFTLRLPVTIAMTRMLVVGAGRNRYALPSQMVRHVMLNEPHDIRAAHFAGKIVWRDHEYRMSGLPHTLERTRPSFNPPSSAIVLIADGENRLGLDVESVVGQFDLIIKNIGTRFARVSGVTGAAILPGGEVVLALNPFLARVPPAGGLTEPPAVLLEGERPPRRALVVDDSLTVRQITGRLLTKDGFEVSTAKDGVEALEKVREQLPHVVVLDIEMPRMDGFELMQSLRADPATCKIGIIVITSRSAEKHRNRAMDSGADEFLGKPYSDEELLDKVHVLESVLATRV